MWEQLLLAMARDGSGCSNCGRDTTGHLDVDVGLGLVSIGPAPHRTTTCRTQTYLSGQRPAGVAESCCTWRCN